MKLTGKVALVTGGSRGIGFAIAKILSENGATVVITSKNQERLEKSTVKIPNAIGIVADIKNKNDVKNVVFNNLGRPSINGKAHAHVRIYKFNQC